MNTLLTVLCTLSLLAAPALAQDKKAPRKEQSPVHKRQVERMNQCNREAADRKGSERRRFMNTCLQANADKPDPRLAGQQERVKDCSSEAAERGLKGDARMRFMGACLKR